MKLQPNEVITLLLGLVVLFYVFSAKRREILKLPHARLLLSSFVLLVASWLATNLEEFLANDVLNFIQHFMRAASPVVLLSWCLAVMSRTGRRKE